MMLQPPATPPSRRARAAPWLLLALLAALAWAAVVAEARAMGDRAGMTGTAPPAPFPLYLAVWLAMMVAMMFPALAPVVALVAALGRARRGTDQLAPSLWLFLAGYLAVWGAIGVGADLLADGVPALGMAAPGLRAYSPLAAGGVLVLAGLYQWSPLKATCLRHCRSPMGALLHHWRDGRLGAFRMGLGHGAYCLGCCAGLMLVLFAVGLMNLAWMAVLALVIFAEKVVPRGPLAGKAVGVALVALGLGVAIAGL